jgi:hypothetical protein
VFWSPVEGAKAAVRDADVGIVDVPVDDVRDRVMRMFGGANAISLEAELEEGRIPVEVQQRGQGQRAKVKGKVVSSTVN